LNTVPHLKPFAATFSINTQHSTTVDNVQAKSL